ncbi:MAG: flagellar basal-body MS-ring/collar protein FliF [Rhodospirillales bacterium]
MRTAVMAGVVLALAVFLIALTSQYSISNKQLLYADLSNKDISRIVQELESRNIPYEVGEEGGTVMVPGDELEALRITLANQGLPSGGSIVGYELFDDTDAIGSTNFQQNVNLVRAMEGELSRTIESLDNVNKARVHLVLPKREMFSRTSREPSASVILNMSGLGRLQRDEVSAVQHLVATAVPNLKPHRISIVDNRGKLLISGNEGPDGVGGDFNTKLEERRRGYEARMAQTVEQLLENTVGIGNVRAEVTAEMDFDRINTTEETFDPDSQVARSITLLEENNQSRDAEGPPPVTVGQNLPDPNLISGDNLTSETSENRTEEVTNFEISKKTTNHVREIGTVQRLSIAVLVDGEVTFDDEGQRQWAPLPERTMQLLATLVRGAVGFNGERGDIVEVINMEFKDLVAEEDKIELFFGMDKNSLIRIAEFVVVGIVALLFILLVIRPLISRAFEMASGVGPTGERLLADGGPGGAPALMGPGGIGGPMEDAPEDDDELIDIDRVEGRVKASSVRKVSEIIGKHPEESLSIIRAWMYQEG